MVATAMIPAIKSAIKHNEIGNKSPYELSFACYGSSGASFGIFQGDIGVNNIARSTFLQILQQNNMAENIYTAIMKQLCRPCPNGNPLVPSAITQVNNCLTSPSGRAAIDAMDDKLLQVVLAEIDTCIATAAARKMLLDPIVILYIALWVNMTGAPTTLNKWLSGIPEFGLLLPQMPIVTQSYIRQYLQNTVYFQLHAKNFLHLEESVHSAVGLLPTPQ